jgi:APA family basic amino acid/polyamine antiporter
VLPLSTNGDTMTQVQSEETQTDLKRVMGPKLLLLFIVGDVLGAGVYAVTGTIAGEVGGIAWLPFLIAFAVAALTAASYLELVTKYPEAAGAALYAHKAFQIHFVTFLVAFAVISSGITSAATSSRLVGSNLLAGLDATIGAAGLDWITIPTGDTTALVVAMSFIALLALINLRGVGQSLKFNVVLTLVEMLALGIVIGVGMWVMGRGDGDLSRVVDFEASDGTGILLAVTTATAVAFFSMVGFEDSVNMVEETKDPERVFPRAMFTALGIAVVIYMLVAVAVVAILSTDQITAGADSDTGVLLAAVQEGVPDFPVSTIFPFLTVFAVANTALINMLMASRLIYGLAKQNVLPRPLAAVSPGTRSPWAGVIFATVLALVLILVVEQLAESTVTALAGTTGLLLLCVFAVVNVSVLVLRREPPNGKFRAPTWAPVVAAVACLFLAGPWARDRDDWVQYQLAGGLLVLGVVLWAITWVLNKRASRSTDIDDTTGLSG